MPRIRVTFEKKGWMTFVNHMDLPTLFARAARRAGLQQEFTQGFSPHPHISLASPLAIGVEGWCEPAEFWFEGWDEGSLDKWNNNLPQGIKFLKWAEVDGPSLAKLATAAVYRFRGRGFAFDEASLGVLEEDVRKNGLLFSSSCDEESALLTVGGLERCGAGNLVKALAARGVCRGWQDLRIVRETVGAWDQAAGAVLPLI